MSLGDFIPVPVSLDGKGKSMIQRAEDAIAALEAALVEIDAAGERLRLYLARIEAVEQAADIRRRQEVGITAADLDAVQ